MEEDNWDSILLLREQSHKMYLDVLDGGCELGTGVDFVLASSPAPVNAFPSDKINGE